MDETRVLSSNGSAVWLWMAFVVLASLGLSRAFACATPFAAVAVVAASTLPWRRALAQVVLVWLGNQAIGFGFMHYPHTVATIGWGGAIGFAALASFWAAWAVVRLISASPIAVAAIGLLPAYAAYEAILFAATWVLPSGSGAFVPAVLLRILAINAVALSLLFTARHLTARPGIDASRPAVTGHG